MKVLVTGGAGFIGSNFVRMAVNGSFPKISKISVLDSLTYAGNLENLSSVVDEIEFIQGDIRDGDITRKIINNFDGLINFAAESHVDRSIEDPRRFMDTNVIGVHNLLESAKPIEGFRFLQVSTDEVYGSINEGSWTENSPVQPNSPYSASKASADLLVGSYFKTFGMNTAITRCSNNYGPFQFPEKIIPFFVTRLLDQKKLPIYGDGSNRRDWLHVSDHCEGIYKVFMHPAAGEIFNLGGGEELSNLNLTQKILQNLGRTESEIEFIEDRKGHDFRYSVDFSKVTSQLGYNPRIDFETGLGETINWYVENKPWWRNLVKN
jgi:dTDP-glucose 4,6-dehydratase